MRVSAPHGPVTADTRWEVWVGGGGHEQRVYVDASLEGDGRTVLTLSFRELDHIDRLIGALTEAKGRLAEADDREVV